MVKVQQRNTHIIENTYISSSIVRHHDTYEVNKILWERNGNTMNIKDATCNYYGYYREGIKDYNSNFMCISKTI